MRAKVTYRLANDVPAMELVTADYEAQRFREHWHLGFTIGAVTRHAQGFRCNGIEWTAGCEDLIVLNPMQIHDGYSIGGAWSTRMVYLPETTFARMLCLGAEGDACTLGRFSSPVIRSTTLHDEFVEWHRRANETTAVCNDPRTLELFRRLGAALVGPLDAQTSTVSTADTQGLAHRLGELADVGHLSLKELSANLACSRSTSWRRAKREVGLAPKVLITQLRLIKAKRLLAEGTTVIDAALECGYHDQSHFSREFAAAYGITAGQFRKVQLVRSTSGRS